MLLTVRTISLGVCFGCADRNGCMWSGEIWSGGWLPKRDDDDGLVLAKRSPDEPCGECLPSGSWRIRDQDERVSREPSGSWISSPETPVCTRSRPWLTCDSGGSFRYASRHIFEQKTRLVPSTVSVSGGFGNGRPQCLQRRSSGLGLDTCCGVRMSSDTTPLLMSLPSVRSHPDALPKLRGAFAGTVVDRYAPLEEATSH